MDTPRSYLMAELGAVDATPLSFARRRGLVDATPSSMAARRGTVDILPLSIAARRGSVDAPKLSIAEKHGGLDALPAPLAAEKDPRARPLPSVAAGNVKTEVKPLGLCARRGAQELQIKLQTTHSPTTSLSPGISEGSTCGSLLSDEAPSSSSSEASMDDWGYEVGEVLGSGSLATVYKVMRRWDGSEFASKHVISREVEQLKSLRNEFDILSSLDHPSIVPAKALYEKKLSAWLCMELCRDGSVEQYIARHGTFNNQRACTLMMQLLEGVNYLHCRRVVHRDVKPANLLLHQNAAKLKIGDFNAARQIGCKQKAVIMLSDRGTQLYSAPEIRFELQWNERVDIWSSGLCGFYMLRAALPFNMACRRSTGLLQKGRLPPIVWEGVADCMRDLVLQCLTVEMRDRPTAMELLLHPLVSDSCAGSSCRPISTNDVAGLSPFGASLMSCGLLAVPPGSCAVQTQACRPSRGAGPYEALNKLAKNRCLRLAGGPLALPAHHTAFF